MLSSPGSRGSAPAWAKRAATIAAACAWFIGLALLRYRLPYGAGNRDEAFYSAMPYSFLLGNRPYVDELALHQNAGILLLPFFRTYLAIAGSADGIILFNRYLYFVYVSICSVVAYRLVRRLSGSATACCAAALIVVFSYINLFALSYNTVGAFSFFCGVVCTANALLHERPGWRLFGASLLFLAAMFAYPGMTPAVLVYLCVVVYWLVRKTPRATLRNGLVGLGAGAGLTLTVVLGLLSWLGQVGIDRLRAFSQSMGYAQNTLSKLNFVHSDAWPWRWSLCGFVALFVAIPVAARWSGRWLWAVAPLLIPAYLYAYSAGVMLAKPTAATICLTALPVLAPVCIALNKRWAHAGFVLQLLWLPSVLSMLCITCSSANGIFAGSLGVLGALVAGLLALAALLFSPRREAPAHWLSASLVFASLFGCLFYHECYSLFLGVYDDSPPFESHTARVKHGPMRGVLASPHDAQVLEAVDKDLKALEPSAKSITVFDAFPTGYMSTRLQPRTFTAWVIWIMKPAYTRQVVKETFGNRESAPDLVLAIHLDDGARHYWQKYLDHYHAVIRRPELHYVIWQKN